MLALVLALSLAVDDPPQVEQNPVEVRFFVDVLGAATGVAIPAGALALVCRTGDPSCLGLIGAGLSTFAVPALVTLGTWVAHALAGGHHRPWLTFAVTGVITAVATIFTVGMELGSSGRGYGGVSSSPTFLPAVAGVATGVATIASPFLLELATRDP